MGLGPLICCHCHIFAVRDQGNNDRCPQCGEENYLDYLWMFDETQQKRITANSKFYRFVAGEDVT